MQIKLLFDLHFLQQQDLSINAFDVYSELYQIILQLKDKNIAQLLFLQVLIREWILKTL
jgi:hypothetical protein